MSMGSKNAVISNLGFIPLAYLQRSKQTISKQTGLKRQNSHPLKPFRPIYSSTLSNSNTLIKVHVHYPQQFNNVDSCARIGSRCRSNTLSICALISVKAPLVLDPLQLISELDRDTSALASRINHSRESVLYPVAFQLISLSQEVDFNNISL